MTHNVSGGTLNRTRFTSLSRSTLAAAVSVWRRPVRFIWVLGVAALSARLSQQRQLHLDGDGRLRFEGGSDVPDNGPRGGVAGKLRLRLRAGQSMSELDMVPVLLTKFKPSAYGSCQSNPDVHDLHPIQSINIWFKIELLNYFPTRLYTVVMLNFGRG